MSWSLSRRPVALIFFALLSCMVPLSKAVAVDFHVDESDLKPEEVRVMNQMVSELKTRLPKTMQDALSGKPIKIKTRDYPERVVGGRNGSDFTVDRKLITAFANSPDPKTERVNVDRKLAHHHKTLFAITAASFIHEASHVYDNLNIQRPSFLQKVALCQSQRYVTESSDLATTNAACAELLDTNSTVSTQPEYLEAAQYRRIGLAQRTLERMNFLETTSPDRNEWLSPRESFAINMEFFLLDPEYKCRRPEVFAALSNHFGQHDPFPNSSCKGTPSLMVIKNDQEGNEVTFEEMAAERIFQVHYFHAEPGSGMASAYGHSMLRLVMCAPERKEVNDDCLEDVEYHRVISFRANTYNLVLDYSKALNGGYDSYEFVMPLLSVVSEYTVQELRDVASYPLKIDRAEIRSVLANLISTQWTYRGNYLYLKNNCSHEILALLKRALPHRKGLWDINIVKPDTFLAALKNAGLIDARPLADRTKATLTGHLFTSKRAHLDHALAILHRNGLLPAKLTPEAFLQVPQDLRESIVSTVLATPVTNANASILGSVTALEVYALMRAKLEMVASAIEALTKFKNSNEENLRTQSVKSIQTSAELVKVFSNPSTLLPKGTGYGIPSDKEAAAIFTDPEVKQHFALSKKVNEDLNSSYRVLAARERSATFDAIRDRVIKLRVLLKQAPKQNQSKGEK